MKSALGLGPVREREREVVRVLERRRERRVQVHRALERVVEAEVARLRVLDDGDRVVGALLAEEDVEPLRLEVRLLARRRRGAGRPASSSRPQRPRAVPSAPARARSTARPPCSGCETATPKIGGERAAATSAVPARSAAAPCASSWFVPNSGMRTNAVANVPTMLPKVETANSRPAVRPSVSTDFAAIRTATGGLLGEHDAYRPEKQDGGDERVQARAGVPLDHPPQDAVVRERDREHQQRTERHHAEQEVHRRPAVRQRAADPVPDREAGEHDADQGAPDVERVAEERREHPAGRDLHAEQHRAGDEDGEVERRAVERGPHGPEASCEGNSYRAVHGPPYVSFASIRRRRLRRGRARRRTGSPSDSRRAPRARGRRRTRSPTCASHLLRAAARGSAADRCAPPRAGSSRRTTFTAGSGSPGSIATVLLPTARVTRATAASRASVFRAPVSRTDHTNGTTSSSSVTGATACSRPA